MHRDNLDAGAGADREARGVEVGRAIERLCFLVDREGEGRFPQLLLGVLDAEIQIAPEEEKDGGFDAGFEQLNWIGSGKDDVADAKRGGGTGKKGPHEGTELQGDPWKRPLNQGAADEAKGQAGEKYPETNDNLIGE